MKKIFALASIAWLWAGAAIAQTSPNLTFGQVLTPAQWNQLFINKQDTLGYTPLNVAGGIMQGPLVTFVSSSIQTGFNIPPGVAPGSPNNGDVWSTTAGLYVQINGSTVGPLTSAATPCSICALVNNSNNFSVAQVVNINGGTLASALTGTAVRAANANSVATRFEADAYGATAYFSAVAYGGTLASPTALGSGVEIGGVNGWGYNGTAIVGPSAALRLFTNGIWSGTSQPTYVDIAVTPSGSTAEIEAIKFTATSTTAVNALLGTPGSIVGSFSFGNATSGTETISPATGALGSGIATLPAGSYNIVGDSLTQTLTNKTLTSATDILGGVTMTLGSDATGDLYCRSGGVLTRVGIGSASTLLTSGGPGTCPTWVAAPGGGNVSNTGTPTANQFALWTNTTTIEGVTATAHAIVVGEGTSAPNYVGPGTVGQFDAAQGASADPSFVSGPWTLLATLTASNSASLSDTTHITSTYSDYEIVFENILPATSATSCEILLHSNGSFQSSGYLMTVLAWDNTTVAANANTAFLNCSFGSAASNTIPINGTLRLYSPSQTSTPKPFHGEFTGISSGSIGYGIKPSGAWNGGNTAIDGFQVIMASGNITSGTIKIYGRL